MTITTCFSLPQNKTQRTEFFTNNKHTQFVHVSFYPLIILFQTRIHSNIKNKTKSLDLVCTTRTEKQRKKKQGLKDSPCFLSLSNSNGVAIAISIAEAWHHRESRTSRVGWFVDVKGQRQVKRNRSSICV